MNETTLEARRGSDARFKERKSSSESFIDTRSAEDNREIFNSMGRGVTETTPLQAVMKEKLDLNLLESHK